MRRIRREFYIGIVQAMTARRTAKLPYVDDE
ncbi:hypothetical protein T11_5753 [Trichinella zimbabwensis]|uniref:Uncharacterized protein n=1 Tax=Trichinella zimbabwensis TaxID=268475 RepID=A0A0V1GIK2_9BILA|nr:hypothetical protein T11_5753 [Trichinella zimbabwensis]